METHTPRLRDYGCFGGRQNTDCVGCPRQKDCRAIYDFDRATWARDLDNPSTFGDNADIEQASNPTDTPARVGLYPCTRADYEILGLSGAWQAEIERRIDARDKMMKLKRRDRRIIDMLAAGYTQEAVAEMHGLTQERIVAIFKKTKQ